VFKTMGYDAVTFGNHEFDWGQTVLGDRVAQANNADGNPNTKEFLFLAANVVLQGAAPDCASTGWDLPSFIPGAYRVFEIPTSTTPPRVGVIGVTTQETATIVKSSAVAGGLFQRPGGGHPPLLRRAAGGRRKVFAGLIRRQRFCPLEDSSYRARR
jgi:2',3'-cyclic-nucleotide 2'-phosphodiesterase (5'-nucleotidase family)